MQDAHGRTDYAVVLIKGERERYDEETVVARLVLHALADACGIETAPIELLPGEQIVRTHCEFADPVHALLENRARTVSAHADGRLISDEPFFPITPYVGSLRLRAAYGHSGQQAGQGDVFNNYQPATVYVNDTWIAACCLVNRTPLATFNTKDFVDFAQSDGLRLITD